MEAQTVLNNLPVIRLYYLSKKIRARTGRLRCPSADDYQLLPGTFLRCSWAIRCRGSDPVYDNMHYFIRFACNSMVVGLSIDAVGVFVQLIFLMKSG